MILAIAHIYNEYPYLPDVVAYYKGQGIDLYFIDNYSNDGSYEWLIANNIQCHRFDTKESFDLPALQQEMNKVIHGIRPEWIIYIAADLFYLFDKPIKRVIEKVESLGFNQIETKCYCAFNCGEIYGLPLYRHYFRGKYYKPLTMISKYDESLKFVNDSIQINNTTVYSDGLVINYGGCKTQLEQDIKLERSKRAWDNGMRIQIGKHFRQAKIHDWIYTRKETINLVNELLLLEQFIEGN